MRPFTSFLIFALILVILRRVTGIPISIVGSLVLTILVNIVIIRLAGDRND
jgi:hypothetical protein